MSGSNCCFLAYMQVSQETSMVVWYSYLFMIFPQFVVIHTSQSQRLNHSQWSRSNVLKNFLCDQMNVSNLISGSSAFPKSSLYIWKFSVHVLLKPSLKNFEHYLASMWNECDCVVVWTFFGTACLWDWNKNQFPWDPLNLVFGLSWQNQGTYSPVN